MYNYTEIASDKCEFVSIANKEELPDGERLFVEIDDLSIVVFNIGGHYYAIADICSHDDGPLGDGEVDGFELSCPRHGAHFDVRNGRALSLPAVVDIPAYLIRLNNGELEVGLPIDE